MAIKLKETVTARAATAALIMSKGRASREVVFDIERTVGTYSRVSAQLARGAQPAASLEVPVGVESSQGPGEAHTFGSQGFPRKRFLVSPCLKLRGGNMNTVKKAIVMIAVSGLAFAGTASTASAASVPTKKPAVCKVHVAKKPLGKKALAKKAAAPKAKKAKATRAC